MAVPMTLTAMTSVALVEGIKFMYAQAGELFKRRREKAHGTLETELPATLGGGRLTAEPDIAVVERNASRMAELRGRLANYADGTLDVDPGDERLLVTVAELRDLIEQSLGRHLTFTVEHDRPATGVVLATGRVQAGEIRGTHITGVEVDELTGGAAHGGVQVDSADQSIITGGRFGRVGPPSRNS